MRMIARLHLLLMREKGQTMAEYGVVLAVITVACLAVFGLLSGGITKSVQKVVDVLPK